MAERKKKITKLKNQSSKKRALKHVIRKITKKPAKHKRTSLDLKRHANNPILEPRTERDWESRATFNPTAALIDNKVHILYRAIGNDDRSVIGYANSHDGYAIAEKLDHPVYEEDTARSAGITLQIPYSSGGGTAGGSEDPRLTIIDDTAYMIYTSFDGWGSLRMTLTSITIEDFLNKRWRWKTPVHISPPNEIHKCWVLFPEKIRGKFAILHGLSPEVQIDYFDNLNELDGKHYIKSTYSSNGPSAKSWDNWMRGVGPAPIKTKLGWLVLYHAMDKRDPNRYKLGAMLLDLKDPTKIIIRSRQPVLEPDEDYENNGFKWGVVYSCGAVVKDGTLLVYYGGADSVSCVAAANLNAFLKELITHGRPGISRRGR